MEKIIVIESGFIEREKYQRIKKEMNKTDDWFTAEEVETLGKLVKKLT